MDLIYVSLIVFAITLTITKADILRSKREFVTKRYEASKLNGRPSFIHTWFYKMFVCPMCVGFPTSLIASICFLTQFQYKYIGEVLIVYGLNWLWHCLEDALFYIGRLAKNKLENGKNNHFIV